MRESHNNRHATAMCRHSVFINNNRRGVKVAKPHTFTTKLRKRIYTANIAIRFNRVFSTCFWTISASILLGCTIRIARRCPRSDVKGRCVATAHPARAGCVPWYRSAASTRWCDMCATRFVSDGWQFRDGAQDNRPDCRQPAGPASRY